MGRRKGGMGDEGGKEEVEAEEQKDKWRGRKEQEQKGVVEVGEAKEGKEEGGG